MTLISGEAVVHNYGERDVLAAVEFHLEAGDRVGLVGPNGEGKTTLLRIAAGLLTPTSGRVRRRRGLRVGFLPQDPPAGREGTLWQATLEAFDDLRRMHAEMERLAARLAESDPDPALLKRFGAMQHEFEARGGYTAEVRAKTVLTALGFDGEQCRRPLAQLSGGQRNRAMLGRLLLLEPDVLLLDEPTNHLDMSAVEWLERWLGGFRNTLVVVSHDRYFLDRTTGRTWEVAFGQLESYRGSYTAYLKQRRHRYRERMRVWTAQQEHIRRTEDFIRRHHAATRAKEARGRRVRLERFLRDEAVDRPRTHRQIRLKLTPDRPSGEIVLAVRGLAVGYDPARPLLAMEDVKLHRGQRVAVVGANGVGKTTLLRALLGELEPLAGEVTRGAKVLSGYLPQTHDRLDAGITALEAVLRAGGAGTPPQRARNLLGSLLLGDDEVFQTIGRLSGGQRSRVVLATLAIQGANLLILDEPTNHLDIPSQEVLQDALARFEGTIVFVSHDRYLIDALGTQIWAIQDGSCNRIWGNWEAYLRWRSDRAAAPPPEGPDARPSPRPRPAKPRDRRKERQRLQRRQEKLEEEIHGLERELGEMSEAISQAGTAGEIEEVRRLGEAYRQADGRLKGLWAEWTELTETIEG